MAGPCETADFTITHPFHPLSGKTLPVAGTYTHTGTTYVHYIDHEGNTRSIRSSWTDYDERAGRSLRQESTSTFSYESLVELKRVLSEIRLARDMEHEGPSTASDPS